MTIGLHSLTLVEWTASLAFHGSIIVSVDEDIPVSEALLEDGSKMITKDLIFTH